MARTAYWIVFLLAFFGPTCLCAGSFLLGEAHGGPTALYYGLLALPVGVLVVAGLTAWSTLRPR